MKLLIDLPHALALAEACPALAALPEQLRFGHRFEVVHLLPALLRHLADGAILGWLFRADAEGKPLPRVVTRIDFVARCAMFRALDPVDIPVDIPVEIPVEQP